MSVILDPYVTAHTQHGVISMDRQTLIHLLQGWYMAYPQHMQAYVAGMRRAGIPHLAALAQVYPAHFTQLLQWLMASFPAPASPGAEIPQGRDVPRGGSQSGGMRDGPIVVHRRRDQPTSTMEPRRQPDNLMQPDQPQPAGRVRRRSSRRVELPSGKKVSPDLYIALGRPQTRQEEQHALGQLGNEPELMDEYRAA